jgi:carbamoyltransferase
VNASRETQEVFVATMVALAREAKEKTGASYLALAGGCALSCVANRAIIDAGIFEEVFVQPAASDEGIALGCALLGYHGLLRGKERRHMETAYLGRTYPRERIQGLLRRFDLAYREACPEEVANRLASGKVMGRFSGGSEFGPRALGNRSILADPRDPDMNRRVNVDIKHRETFRPFAPSCLAESKSEYFDLPFEAAFMLVAAPVLPGCRTALPAITHVDGSSRPQTVRRSQNPGYYSLIEAFGKITGYDTVLNTSFNDNEEPVVETPEDAIISFISTNLDGLDLQSCLLDRLPDGEAVRRQLTSERDGWITASREVMTERLCDMRKLQDALSGGQPDR